MKGRDPTFGPRILAPNYYKLAAKSGHTCGVFLSTSWATKKPHCSEAFHCFPILQPMVNSCRWIAVRYPHFHDLRPRPRLDPAEGGAAAENAGHGPTATADIWRAAAAQALHFHCHSRRRHTL